MSGELKSRVVKGTFWAFLERISAQLVTFGVGIILARLLSPTDYGTVALLGVFTAIAGVLADSGFGGALIQKKDATELDYNSVFYLSLALTSLMYVILFSIAPWVSRFYNIPELCPILRVVSISLLFNSINSIQGAELARKMLFHLSFRISMITTITSAVCGITLAFLGFGVWALVWTGLVTSIVGTISRWFIIAWRPKLMFSFAALKPLFKYGWKITCSALLDTGFNNLYGLIIGKYYSRADLSFVNKGRALPQLLMDNVNGTLGCVAFPALAKLQDDRLKLRESMRRMMAVSTFFVFPLMTLCAVAAKNTILFLYGEKWAFAAPYAMITCFTFALWPFHTINLQGIQAIGRSDVFLKLEIIKKTIALTVLISCLSQSVLLWCLIGAFVTSPLAVIINAWPNRKLLDYSLKMQLLDILPAALVCGVMAIPLIAINFIPCTSQGVRFCILVAQGIIGSALYLGLSILFRLRGIREVATIVKPKLIEKVPRLAPLSNYLET